MNEFFLDYHKKWTTLGYFHMKISHSVSFFYFGKINDAHTFTGSGSASYAFILCVQINVWVLSECRIVSVGK